MAPPDEVVDGTADARSHLLDRIREDRRVRLEFERLISAQDFKFLDSSVRGKRERMPPIWRRGWRWWTPRVALAVVVALIATAVTILYAPLPFDPPTPLQTAFVYDTDGNLLARLHAAEDRVVVPISKIPKRVQEAVIASEDERFYHHAGIDLWALLRAGWHDLTGKPLEGGSTITQQLVKNYYVGSERTLGRKIREAVLAMRLEHKLSKQEILERYLNTIYFGEGAYGVEAAAQVFFRTHVQDLTLAQAALIAGVAPAPSAYDPRRDPDAATGRRNHVLDRMVANGFVSESEAAAARLEPLGLAPVRAQITRARYFVDYARGAVVGKYGEDLLYRGGLQITTTLDLGLQRAAERAIEEVMNRPGDPSAALVAIDVHTGAIRAMAGGAGFYNLSVQGKRQAGSSFKPFTLATALSEGISPYHVYSAPGSIDVNGYTVHNYDGHSYGSLTVRSATVYSVNTVYVQMIRDAGAADVADTAHRMGIRSPLSEDLSMTLGTSSVSPLEMTSAYATLAAGGVYHKPTAVQRVVDASGKTLESLPDHPGGRRALKADVAGQVNAILQDVVRYGTGSSAQLNDRQMAGKTGTTDDHADAWFCGYTADLATCVWVGYPKARIPMSNVHGIAVTGGSLPAAIWRAFMSQTPVPDGTIPVATLSGSPGYSGSVTTGPTTAPAGGGGPGPQPTGPAGPPAPQPTPTGGGGGILCILGCN